MTDAAQIKNSFWINLGTNGRGNTEVHKSNLRRAVGVCSERNTAAFFPDWSRVFGLAAQLDKAVEIDCYPDRQDLSIDLLEIAR